MRRTIIPWIAAFGILALATVGGVALANATVLGAGAFVRGYLDALARGDTESVLALPGVDAAGADPALLTPDALTGLTEVRELTDDDLGDGVHRVSFVWVAPDGSGRTSLLVERVGTRFGLFPVWGFAESPVATVSVEVSNDSDFLVNGLEADTGRDTAGGVDYAVLVPGSYVFDHESALLTADDVVLSVDEPGERVAASIEVRANDDFVAQAQREVDEYLADCVAQQVLFPTGCPFGRAIQNRVAEPPKWSIVAGPDIRVIPGDDFGTWVVPESRGEARLVVKVQSLFDGSISTLDKTIEFDIDFEIDVSP